MKFASLRQEVGECEEEWKEFRNSMQECAKSVCGVRRVGGSGRGTEWWNEDVQGLVERKKRAYGVWLQVRTEEKRRNYRDCCRLVKQKVRESKERANETGVSVLQIALRRIRKCFGRL